MRILLLAVGRARGDVADAIAEYEKRAGRYFSFEAVEVKEEQFRGKGDVVTPEPRVLAKVVRFDIFG